MSKVVTSYEVFDHGIENSQYFQGWSPPRDFDDGATGAGDNPHEAMEDALEMIAQGGDWELGTVVNDMPDTPSVAEEMAPEVEECPTCNGTGRVVDEDHDGWGTPTVEGHGEDATYGVEPETVECPDCEGTGNAGDPGDDYGDNDMNYYVSVAVKGIDATLDGAWMTDTVKQLAQGVLESGDGEAAAVVADALEEAGCRNEDLLEWLRGSEGDWNEVERVLRWMLGEYAMQGQNGTDYLSSNGLMFNDFFQAAIKALPLPKFTPQHEGDEGVWIGGLVGQTDYGPFNSVEERKQWEEDRIALYDFIKERWPYGGTPERAAEDYYNSVGAT